jgi:hypothetical protein
MKYQKNIISVKTINNSLNNGFTIAELVVTVTVATFLITTIVSSLFMLFRGFSIAKKNSISIKEKAECFEQIINDIYNIDTFPHRPGSEYILEEKHITFYANSMKADYLFSNGKLTVTYDDEEKIEYDIFKDFIIKYYSRDDLQVFPDDEYHPYYCEMIFILKDNNEKIIEMKL